MVVVLVSTGVEKLGVQVWSSGLSVRLSTEVSVEVAACEVVKQRLDVG
jgi:hypothetical protein